MTRTPLLSALRSLARESRAARRAHLPLDADGAAVAELSCASSTAVSRRLDSLSVHAWIASRVEGGHASELGALLDVAYAGEFGADTSDQSAVNLLWMLGEQPAPGGFEAFGASDERFRVQGGNQRVCAAIAGELGSAAAIHTGQRLEALSAAADGSLRLALAAGGATRDWSFDFAILALPFATLRGLDLARAGFDALQRRIVEELGRGRCGKLQLQLAQPVGARSGPWPGVASGASFHDGAYQTSWDSARGQAGPQALICLYTGGSLAEQTDSTAAFGTQASPAAARDARRGLRAFDAVFPGSEGAWNGRATLSLPFRSEHLKLAYSYYRVGQVQAFSGREAAPQGPDQTILLAGEHTSVEFQGFMEGAAVSGRDAARRVVERVRA